MAVNLKAIDAKIRKLQKLRELLVDDDTRELIADPDVMIMLREAVSSNGNGNSHSPSISTPEQEEEDLPAQGSLKRFVLDTARACSAKFDTASIVQMMRNAGFVFDAAEPKVSVNQALTKLADKKLIRLVRRGSGRQPNIYEAARREGTMEHK